MGLHTAIYTASAPNNTKRAELYAVQQERHVGVADSAAADAVQLHLLLVFAAEVPLLCCVGFSLGARFGLAEADFLRMIRRLPDQHISQTNTAVAAQHQRTNQQQEARAARRCTGRLGVTAAAAAAATTAGLLWLCYCCRVVLCWIFAGARFELVDLRFSTSTKPAQTIRSSMR